MQPHLHKSFDGFAQQHHIEGLTLPSLVALTEEQDGYSVDKAKRFLAFQHRINKEMLKHRVIIRNPYTAWFELGNQSPSQIKAFIIQFSVYSYHTGLPLSRPGRKSRCLV